MTVQVRNPYLELAIEANGGNSQPNGYDRPLSYTMLVPTLESRRVGVDKYGFAVPTQKALDCVARYSPILELGAGCAYWAMLLRDMGVDIIAFDKYRPPLTPEGVGYGWQTTWTDVLVGDERAAASYPDRALLMIWPSLNDPWAARAVELYRGRTVLYVGEGSGGCTGDDALHARLAAEWEQVEEAPVYQWWGVHDWLYVYQRSSHAPWGKRKGRTLEA